MSRETFPVDGYIPQISKALKEFGSAVLTAPTGTGKTTRVPPALLDLGFFNDGICLMLQPRRVAARAVAGHMARQLGEKPGERVGYQVRFEKKQSDRTRIMVVTEGILTRKILADPLLEHVAMVILDEFHERSIHADLALAFLRELKELRDDLKVLVMSATLAAEPVRRFLGDVPLIEVEARRYPLDIRYLDFPADTRLTERVLAGVAQVLGDSDDDGGDLLIFQPGVGEINHAIEQLKNRFPNIEWLPLHGSLTAAEQDRVFLKSSQRRGIVATNIAETSLTIPGISIVVDSGYCKTIIHDHRKGIDRLDLTRISRASADQRAGRAGRTGPGRAVRLWSEMRHHALAAQDVPEIKRIDLAGPLLQIIDFHGPNLDDFPFFESPPVEAVSQALSLLKLLGAVDGETRITENGKRFLAMPLHPRLAAVLDKAREIGELALGARIAALLSEGRWFADSVIADPRDPIWSGRMANVVRQLEQIAARGGQSGKTQTGSFHDRVALLVLRGFPDRVCKSASPDRALMVGGRGVETETGAALTRGDLFVALDLSERGRDRTSAKVDALVPVTLSQVIETFDLSYESKVVFEQDRGAVVAVRRLFLEDLLLAEKPDPKPDAGALSFALAAEVLNLRDRVFKPADEALQLMFRIKLAARHFPEKDWPDFEGSDFETLIATACIGKKTLDSVAKSDWFRLMEAQLDWSSRQFLEQSFPAKLTVPSGSQIRIDYGPAFEAAGYPVLAVRLQEMFGMADTPKIAQGRIPLLLHLLAPNYRPAQVTQDLRSFWNQTYAEVRKELRQRYPKHAWPEDPWTAEAVRGAKRKKS